MWRGVLQRASQDCPTNSLLFPIHRVRIARFSTSHQVLQRAWARHSSSRIQLIGPWQSIGTPVGKACAALEPAVNPRIADRVLATESHGRDADIVGVGPLERFLAEYGGHGL